ncbi:Galactose oxidase/kelch beta-propeller [Penicillium sp. IBT 16267x]|nr:Galactose oxidase/kelch beta-propeller [Penicillium sp. IBT 16267x]
MAARYRILEKIYVEQPFDSARKLGKAIVRVYELIMRYLVQARRFFEQRAASRILKGVFVGQEEFQEIMQAADRDEQEVDRWANLVQAEMNSETGTRLATMSSGYFKALQEKLLQMNQPISHLSLQLERMEEHIDSLQRKEVLDWLSSQPYFDHHRTVNSRVLGGTCQWVLQHPSFSDWKRESTNSVLWLHGNQGAGKSCLASAVIDDEIKTTMRSQNFAQAYFYCSRGTSEPQRANAQQVMACIIRQLSAQYAEKSLPTPTLSLYKKMNLTDGSRRGPDLEECQTLAVQLTEVFARVTIVVDALDECDIEERGELVDALEYISNESTSLVKIFLTSREEGDLRIRLNMHTGIQVTSLENGFDIEKFVNFETDRLVAKNQLLTFIRLKSAKQELKAFIKESIITKANGMFRWAQMQLQSLRWIRTEKDIRKALSEIPRPLSELYERLHQRTLENTRETDEILFKNTLKWMLCARSVLEWKDFSQAITCFVDIEADEIDEEFLLDLLNNFVTCETNQEGIRSFRFAHLSVREFLENKLEYCTESSNTYGAEVCLLKLISASGYPEAGRFFRNIGLNAKRITVMSETNTFNKGLLDYCVRNWNLHCSLAGKGNRENNVSHLSRLLLHFLFDDSGPNCPLNCWVKLHQRDVQYLKRDVHLAQMLKNYHQSYDRAFLLSSAFGFREIIHTDRYRNTDEDLKEQCIDVASKQNIFELLLDHNKDLYITEELITSCNPFHSNIEALVRRAPGITITDPIMKNLIVKTDVKALERFLEDHGINITCDLIAEACHLSGAHEQYMHGKLDLLLKRAGPIEGTERAMMQAISANNSPEAVQRLLDLGWPVNQNVIQHAAQCGTAATFELLLNTGGQLTPEVIKFGAENCYDGAQMVKLLVELMGFPLDEDLWVELMQRSAQNAFANPALTQFLLDMRSDFKVREPMLISFIQAIDFHPHISESRRAVMGILLEGGREIEVTDAVIEAALEFLDYDETISRLFDRRGAQNITSETLMAAIRNDRYGADMTTFLLHRNLPIEGPTAAVLEAVIRNRHSGYEILHMLETSFGRFNLARCKSILRPGMATSTMLLAAAATGTLDVMKLLLKLDNPVITNEILGEASRNPLCGNDMIKLLRQNMPDLDLCPEFIKDSLHNGSL